MANNKCVYVFILDFQPFISPDHLPSDHNKIVQRTDSMTECM